MKKQRANRTLKNRVWGYFLMVCVSINLSGCKAFLQSLASTQVAPHQQAVPEASVSCPDVELMGLSGSNTVPGVHLYFAKIRNKAPYTKNVTIEWVDFHGQKQRTASNVPSGQMIDLRLTASGDNDREPHDLRIAACY